MLNTFTSLVTLDEVLLFEIMKGIYCSEFSGIDSLPYMQLK